jgi:molybdopterin-containing oxidoreductase family membrane subunit
MDGRVLSFGWNGTKHWQRHEALALVLAGFTPLLSVTIVSPDFATSIVPGWLQLSFRLTSLRAIFSGFAMVQTLLNNAKSDEAGRYYNRAH